MKTKESFCTATVVGPRVLLTAAHCVSNDGKAKFVLRGVEYQVELTVSPRFRLDARPLSEDDHDLALGVITPAVPLMSFSTIGGRKVRLGQRVQIMGFGMATLNGNGGGILREGVNRIVAFLNEHTIHGDGVNIYFGDSGGPSYDYELLRRRSFHYQVTVHSRTRVDAKEHYDVRLDSPESQDFLEDFAERNGVSICGINVNCDRFYN